MLNEDDPREAVGFDEEFDFVEDARFFEPRLRIAGEASEQGAVSKLMSAITRFLPINR